MIAARGVRETAPIRGTIMSYLQAIVIALVQGVTELFPVSSLGHCRITRCRA
jgi:hypothetical protein